MPNRFQFFASPLFIAIALCAFGLSLYLMGAW